MTDLTYVASSSLPSTSTRAFVDVHTSSPIFTGRSAKSYKMQNNIVTRSLCRKMCSCFFCFSAILQPMFYQKLFGGRWTGRSQWCLHTWDHLLYCVTHARGTGGQCSQRDTGRCQVPHSDHCWHKATRTQLRRDTKKSQSYQSDVESRRKWHCDTHVTCAHAFIHAWIYVRVPLSLR